MCFKVLSFLLFLLLPHLEEEEPVKERETWKEGVWNEVSVCPESAVEVISQTHLYKNLLMKFFLTLKVQDTNGSSVPF